MDLNHKHGIYVSQAAGQLVGIAINGHSPIFDTNYCDNPSIDMNHRHSVTFTPSITDNIGVADNISYSISGDSETRPSNFTMRIWKRIS